MQIHVTAMLPENGVPSFMLPVKVAVVLAVVRLSVAGSKTNTKDPSGAICQLAHGAPLNLILAISISSGSTPDIVTVTGSSEQTLMLSGVTTVSEPIVVYPPKTRAGEKAKGTVKNNNTATMHASATGINHFINFLFEFPLFISASPQSAILTHC